MNFLLSLIVSNLGWSKWVVKLLPYILGIILLIYGYHYVQGKINDRVAAELKRYKESVTLNTKLKVEKDSELIKNTYSGKYPSNITDATARVLKRAEADRNSELRSSGRDSSTERRVGDTNHSELVIYYELSDTEINFIQRNAELLQGK